MCVRATLFVYVFIYNKFFFSVFFGEILRVTSRKEFRTRMKPYCYVTKIFIKLTQSAKKTKDGKKNDEYTDENRKTLSPPYRKRRMCCCVQPLAVSSSSVNRTLKNLSRVLSHTQLLAVKILSVYCPRERDGVYVWVYTVIFKFPVRMFTGACMSAGEQRKAKQPFGTNPFTTMNARRMCRCRGA